LYKQFTAVLTSLLLLSFSVQSATNIGMATGSAAFLVNGAPVTGNATLFEGTTVKAGAAGSRLQLSSGASLQLSPNAQVKAYADRLVMETGSADFRGTKETVEGHGMTVKPASADSAARVVVLEGNVLQVATTRGAFRVYNAEGILMANVKAGMALSFAPQAGSSATTATGCLLKKDNKFVLFDEMTQMLYEMQGSGYDLEWGNRLQVNGTARAAGQPGAGTSQVLVVASFKRVAEGGCLTAASQANAQLPGQAGAAPAPETQQTAQKGKSNKKATAAAAAGGAAAGGAAAGAAAGGLSAGAIIAIVAVGGGAAAGAGIALGGGSKRS
jgi:hypothetical protein